MAEPVQRTVGGRLRYVSCLRFTPRESDGSYRELRERAVLYVDGRLDRMIEKAGEICAGVGLCAVSGTGKDDAVARLVAGHCLRGTPDHFSASLNRNLVLEDAIHRCDRTRRENSEDLSGNKRRCCHAVTVAAIRAPASPRSNQIEATLFV